MKTASIIPLIAAAGLLAAAVAGCSRKEEEPLSLRIVQSEMARCPDAAHLDFMEGTLKWNYTTGLELKAFLDVYGRYGGDGILSYAEQWYDSMIDAQGRIKTYKKSNYSTDHICPGKTLFTLYDLTGKEKYRRAIDTLRAQIASQPRTPEGGFWHKQVYPQQMWLDGLYMAQPFYAEYTFRFEKPALRDSCYRDILKNFLTVAEHTYDPATGLYRHAWDSSHSMFWADSLSGQSLHAWGRALGWYCMAIVDALPYIPDGTEGKDKVLQIFRGIYDVLPRYADKKTGMWYQVLDSPGREGNYTEATCSAMFTYAMLKGIRLGYLPRGMEAYAKKTYRSLLKEFLRSDPDGTLSLERCCSVAGLGGKDRRSGDFDYYVGEAIRDNDPKGMGPLIWAALEMEARPVTLHLIGDSTMAQKDTTGGNPERGWGMYFGEYFDSSVRVVNYARNGRSTKSFIDEGRWDLVKMDLRPGDYVFVEFGHNDAKETSPERYAPAWGAFSDNLRLFIDESRAQGAIPVLLTPVARRKFENGVFVPHTHGDYPAAMKAVAAGTETFLIDMEAATEAWIAQAGDSASKPYFMWVEPGTVEALPEGRQDDTHSTEIGARRNCRIVCDSLRAGIPALARHIIK
ncbi:MAG: glycoside hydrolase family 88 protein [Bacteroidales bacterium]|nr:glycoside hydrolase family 88 protein [Bacteroidales bacterium]